MDPFTVASCTYSHSAQQTCRKVRMMVIIRTYIQISVKTTKHFNHLLPNNCEILKKFCYYNRFWWWWRVILVCLQWCVLFLTFVWICSRHPLWLSSWHGWAMSRCALGFITSFKWGHSSKWWLVWSQSDFAIESWIAALSGQNLGWFHLLVHIVFLNKLIPFSIPWISLWI